MNKKSMQVIASLEMSANAYNADTLTIVNHGTFTIDGNSEIGAHVRKQYLLSDLFKAFA